MYKLVIEDDEGKTTVVPIIRDEITIGRKEGNTIRLTERNVSRRHARLIKEGESLHIEEIESRYGTRHNGEKLDSRRPFREGDVVMIGDYRLSIQIDRSAARKAQQGGSPNPEATQTEMAAIEDDEEIPIPEAGKLVVISSNYAGREYRLTRKEMVIGRTEGDVRIDHRSISRNHAKIVRDGDRYKIVDLRSSNGVRVNGEEYRSVHLKKGDVIELGHVRFRYVEAGEVFHFVPDRNTYNDPSPAGPAQPGGGMGKIIAVGAILAVFLVVLGVVGFLIATSTDGPKDKPVADADVAVTPTPTPTPVGDLVVDALLQDADKAITAENWDAAISLLQTARDKAPGNDDIRDKLSLAQRERPLKQFYDDGKAALDEGRFQDALDSFDKLPSDVNLSAYTNRVKNQGLREQAEEGILSAHLKTAKDAANRKDWATVRLAANEALKRDDKNAEARQLLAQANRELRDEAVADKNKPDDKDKNPKEVAGKDPKEPKDPKANGDKTTPPDGGEVSAEDKKERSRELLAQAAQANRSGQYGEAIRLASEALKYGGGPQATFQIALAYEKQGNNAQAIQNYNRWLKSAPAGRLRDQVRDRVRSMGGTPPE
jgi:pSer/pThr/pTyr-binding forkhead associated (FHA) protein/tetratricopeptide (TPR) repeat protein